MSEIAPRVDPSVFMPANRLLFQASLIAVARQFSQNLLVATAFLCEQGQDMTAVLVPVADEGALAAAKFELAWGARQANAERLCAYVTGLQRHNYEGLLMAYGEDDLGAVGHDSWAATWVRARDVLLTTNDDKTVVDVADMFDELVREQYPTTYDPTDAFRGAEARADVSAYTFYEVMEPHLTHSVNRLDHAVGH